MASKNPNDLILTERAFKAQIEGENAQMERDFAQFFAHLDKLEAENEWIGAQLRDLEDRYAAMQRTGTAPSVALFKADSEFSAHLKESLGKVGQRVADLKKNMPTMPQTAPGLRIRLPIQLQN